MMQNSESNLKFNLKSSDFLVGDLISKTPFSDYFKAQYQNQPEFYLLKRLTISKNNDNLSDITKELSFYDSLSQSSLKLKSTPNYFGYFTTNMPNDIVYNVIFEYFPNSLSFFFEQKQKEPNKKFLSLATLQGILTSMLNVLAYLQANQMCCCGLNPMLLQLDESQNIKFIELGSFQEMKNLKSFYLKKLVKITNSDYMSPENHQFLTNLDSKTEIDPYKSEAFSLGLVILELATFKPLKFKNNLDILAPELKSHFFILSEIYSNSIHTDEEIQKFEHFYKILSKLLQIEAEVRWDFLEAFQNCIYRKEKILYHMFIEESTLGELQGIEWNNFRRIALKKVEEKEVKSIYQKDFEEYMEEIKICDVEAMKKFDYFLSEKGVQGVSFGNLHPEKGQKLLYFLFELLKISHSVEHLALWGNQEHFQKDCFKYFCEALKANKSIKVLNLGDNDLGMQKKAIKNLCQVLKQNQTLTSLNIGGNKLGFSHKNIKPLQKLLSFNKNIQFLGLGSNFLAGNGKCMKFLSDIIKNNKSIMNLSLPNNSFGEHLDEMKMFCDSLLYNKTLMNLNLEYNVLGRNITVFKVFCDSLKCQTSLCLLDLGNNFLGEKTINLIMVEEMLISNNSIKRLCLGNNLIGKNKNGFLNFFDYLKTNMKIEILELDGNGLNEIGEDIEKLEEIFKKNKTLTTISLSENQLEKNKKSYCFLKSLENKYGVDLKI